MATATTGRPAPAAARTPSAWSSTVRRISAGTAALGATGGLSGAWWLEIVAFYIIMFVGAKMGEQLA